MKKTTLLFILLFLYFFTEVQAQCYPTETITVCDMTTVGHDVNNEPDGIINLYDEYNAISGRSISAATGTWFDPNFNFALDETTGNLHLWDLDKTSKLITDYQFQLIDNTSSCPDGIVVTVNLILGPFSGYALSVLNIDDVNLEVCDEGSTPLQMCIPLPDVDLFHTLSSNPSPHLNGEWIYNGNSPNFVSLIGAFFSVTVPYSPGPPLADQESFELTYRISGIAPCDFTLETTVNVSVTRQVFSGYGQATRICELDIIDGKYNADINLTDDNFLLQEDTEGVWLNDAYNQITSPNDSKVNINAIYQQILADKGPRFGCAEFEFSYTVKQRSGVCKDAESKVRFKIYEYLRPFKQKNKSLEFCEDILTTSTSIDLYEQLEFTKEDGVLFDYKKRDYVSWQLLSGPSDLGLKPDSLRLDPDYYKGSINLQNAKPGTYVFEYFVSYAINCGVDFFEAFTYTPNACFPTYNLDGYCNSETAQVVLIVLPKLYAGENTIGLEFCENDTKMTASLDLFSLMTTNGTDEPIYQGPLGVWTDRTTRDVVTNPFDLPKISGRRVFEFVYTTRTANGCVDKANLSFTVFEEYDSGISTTWDVCSTDKPFNMFDKLDGEPSDSGTWTGPNGFVSTDHNANFNPSKSQAGIYTYSVPDNVNDLGEILCLGSQSTVTLAVSQGPKAGKDIGYTVCQSDLQIDLIDYLDVSADSGGLFTDSGGMIVGSILDVSQLNSGSYNFKYEVQGTGPCGPSASILSIFVEEVETPITSNQTFCVIDGPTVEDLVADNGYDFNWYDSETATTPLASYVLLIDGKDYFVEAVDSNNCKSSRVSVVVTILPIGDVNCEDCLKDGVSANGDGSNDEFDLCDLPVSYPNFEINIFNRFGSLVYKGNKNTPLFNGSSNASLTSGNKLPTGVYFYVFDPRDGKTKPLQGNFYLSR